MNLRKLFIFFFLVGSLFPVAGRAEADFSGQLLKARGAPQVYYLDQNNFRHLFPTATVYYSWYNNFNQVQELSLKQLEQYPLAENITVRSGVNIVSFKTDPNFYGVEIGGVLRKFQNYSVIEEIFGPDWSRRVIELPDGFFGDYRLGEEIQESFQLPDGIVYQLDSDGRYYYKRNGIIRPFKNFQSLEENGFQKSDVITSQYQFNCRQREIVGFDSKVFNPVEPPLTKTADCQSKNLKVAFILVTKDGASSSELEKLKKIKKELPDRFSWASDDLATIDVGEPLVVYQNDPVLISEDHSGREQVADEVINTFYDNHQDVFDFIILYNNFVLKESEIAHYLCLTNRVTGTGNPIIDNADCFGSRGKLKGIVNMGNLKKYEIASRHDFNQTLNYILHELLHHWSGRAKFKDESGKTRLDLLDRSHLHWSRFVDFISPLGGSGWQDNGDGTFSNKIVFEEEPNKKKFSQLDLYFMGLLPKQVIDPISYLVPENPKATGNTLAGEMRQVMIDQIIKAMRGRYCQL